MGNTTLLELESKAFRRAIKQKTIDLIQNAECDFGDFEDTEYTHDKLGAYIYEVEICIEIYDPMLKVDILILNELKDILDNKLISLLKEVVA